MKTCLASYGRVTSIRVERPAQWKGPERLTSGVNSAEVSFRRIVSTAGTTHTRRDQRMPTRRAVGDMRAHDSDAAALPVQVFLSAFSILRETTSAMRQAHVNERTPWYTE